MIVLPEVPVVTMVTVEMKTDLSLISILIRNFGRTGKRLMYCDLHFVWCGDYTSVT